MNNFEKKALKKHNPRILITAGSRFRKTNSFNLIMSSSTRY